MCNLCEENELKLSVNRSTERRTAAMKYALPSSVIHAEFEGGDIAIMDLPGDLSRLHVKSPKSPRQHRKHVTPPSTTRMLAALEGKEDNQDEVFQTPPRELQNPSNKTPPTGFECRMYVSKAKHIIHSAIE
uniref:Uncharacterized protein n=1 Tax=Magallana gigas TaxID=29159 RepID=K1PW57_MAGGI